MNDAYEYTCTIVDELNQIEEEWADGNIDDMYEIIEELSPLDWEYTLGTASRELRSIRMIRTVGGPHCYIDFRGNGIAYVTTEWGGERHTVGADVPLIDEHVWEYIHAVIES